MNNFLLFFFFILFFSCGTIREFPDISIYDDTNETAPLRDVVISEKKGRITDSDVKNYGNAKKTILLLSDNSIYKFCMPLIIEKLKLSRGSFFIIGSQLRSLSSYFTNRESLKRYKWELFKYAQTEADQSALSFSLKSALSEDSQNFKFHSSIDNLIKFKDFTGQVFTVEKNKLLASVIIKDRIVKIDRSNGLVHSVNIPNISDLSMLPTLCGAIEIKQER